MATSDLSSDPEARFIAQGLSDLATRGSAEVNRVIQDAASYKASLQAQVSGVEAERDAALAVRDSALNRSEKISSLFTAANLDQPANPAQGVEFVEVAKIHPVVFLVAGYLAYLLWKGKL